MTWTLVAQISILALLAVILFAVVGLVCSALLDDAAKRRNLQVDGNDQQEEPATASLDQTEDAHRGWPRMG